MRIDQEQPQMGTIEAKDPFASAPPGYGLTSDNQKWPWGQPPRQVDPEAALRRAIETVERPKIKMEMLKILMTGASVETLVEGYLLEQFQKGEFMPDVGLLIKGPLAMYLANMAEEEGVLYRFFENNDEFDKGTMDDETFFRMMKRNNPSMFSFIKEEINRGIREGTMPEEVTEENFLSQKEAE